MKIIEVKDSNEWNTFIKQVSPNRFSQSFEWGEFYKAKGFEVQRLALEKGSDLVVGGSIFSNKLFGGKKYWYAPAGPIVKNYDDERNVEEFFKLIKEKAKEEGVIFLRFEPEKELKDIRLPIQKTIDIQPAKSLLLDLTQDEDEILSGMHQKTRYNIRLAGKKGVEVRGAANGEFEKWWEIMEETKKRDNFRLHSKEHYKKMLESGNGGATIKLYVAIYKNEIIAGNIISFFGNTATYVHGASSNKFRNVMAPYALQWYAIEKAKEKGCRFYDFYGIDEEKWPGVTRFKKGFGGEEVDYPGTFDLVFDKKWYNIYTFLRYVRRKIL